MCCSAIFEVTATQQYYRKAREKGVIFLRYDVDQKPKVSVQGQELLVSVKDVMLGKTVSLKPDLLVLTGDYGESRQ